MANGKPKSSGPRKPADGLSSLRKGKGLGKISKRIGAMKNARKRKNDLMRPGKSASPDNPIEVKKGGRIKKRMKRGGRAK